MKFYLVLFIFFISCSGNVQQKVEQPYHIDVKSFRVEVEQSSMMFDEHYIFTNDSIFEKGQIFTTHTLPDSILINRKPSQEESERIMKTLSTINLDSLQMEGQKQNMDDAIEFSFTIWNGTTTKKMNVYLRKEVNLFRLTDSLNTLLPKENKINYNQHYIDNGY